MDKVQSFEFATCQEAGLHGACYPGTNDPIPCGQPGKMVVWHNYDGKNVYVMCLACGTHNVRNRRGIELVPKEGD